MPGSEGVARMEHGVPEPREDGPTWLTFPLGRRAAAFALQSFAIEEHGSTRRGFGARRMSDWAVGPPFPGARDEHGHAVVDRLMKHRSGVFCLGIAVAGFHALRLRPYAVMTCSMQHSGRVSISLRLRRTVVRAAGTYRQRRVGC